MEKYYSDIYFEENYAKLYEKIENGTTEVFSLECEFGKIKNTFIKRKIDNLIDGKEYYDIVTPYGYGGPCILEVNNSKKEELLIFYKEKFGAYCKENNIVREFIRFNPIFKNANDFKSIYNIERVCKTVGTNLEIENPYINEFSKSARKSIRRALNSGITYQIIESPDSLEEFKEIYYSTMDRNNASEYYYFDDYYFDNAIKYYKNNIIFIKVIYKEKIIASAFYFVFNGIIHAHLSGTLSEYLYLSPAYIIKYATLEWGVKNNYSLIHYGGGKGNSDDDPLLKFKKKFTNECIFDFYIGKKVWNKCIYDRLIEGIEEKSGFFPLYRLKNM
ncbi:peptidoglycan bridge formation glycyltransferase FemA/FemB family protein [Clostridium perfringens]